MEPKATVVKSHKPTPVLRNFKKRFQEVPGCCSIDPRISARKISSEWIRSLSSSVSIASPHADWTWGGGRLLGSPLGEKWGKMVTDFEPLRPRLVRDFGHSPSSGKV